MGIKAFISYRYRDSQDLRDYTIRLLGEDAVYYRGELRSSPYQTDYKTAQIRERLADMIYDTPVMVVIVSPNMLQSQWMELEVELALGNYYSERSAECVRGVVCVVKKEEVYNRYGSYSYYTYDAYAWAKENGTWASSKLFDAINRNRNNRVIPKDGLSPHYIDIVTEDDFIKQPTKYITEAYVKSKNLEYYDIS